MNPKQPKETIEQILARQKRNKEAADALKADRAALRTKPVSEKIEETPATTDEDVVAETTAPEENVNTEETNTEVTPEATAAPEIAILAKTSISPQQQELIDKYNESLASKNGAEKAAKTPAKKVVKVTKPAKKAKKVVAPVVKEESKVVVSTASAVAPKETTKAKAAPKTKAKKVK